jgi:hypothetical protein
MQAHVGLLLHNGRFVRKFHGSPAVTGCPNRPEQMQLGKEPGLVFS